MSSDNNASTDEGGKRRGRTTSNENPGNPSKKTRSSSRSSNFNSADIIMAIRASEQRLMTEIQEIRTALDVKLDEVREEFDRKLGALSESVDARLSKLNVESMASEAVDAIKTKCNHLSNVIDGTISATENRIDYLERLHSLRELLITGIPMVDQENVKDIFERMCVAIGSPDSVKVITSIFRLPDKTKRDVTDDTRNNKIISRPIIVKFISADHCRHFIGFYLKHSNLNLSHIGFSTPTRIYCNENLSQRNRDIFRHGLKLKKRETNRSPFLKIYTRQGLVYILFSVNDKARCVRSINEMESLINSVR